MKSSLRPIPFNPIPREGGGGQSTKPFQAEHFRPKSCYYLKTIQDYFKDASRVVQVLQKYYKTTLRLLKYHFKTTWNQSQN